MVFSYYIFKFPYKLVWHLLKIFNKNPDLVIYCADPLDYEILAPVLKYLPDVDFVVKNTKTARYLESNGISCKRMPSFPKTVVMSRHAAYKFPERKILKFGMRHGAYHFKKFTNTNNYNDFDVFMVTSQQEVKKMVEKGISAAAAVGFPKIDPLFDGTYSEAFLNSIRQKVQLDHSQKTVIFSATWDKSGMSAIHNWIDFLPELAEEYNILTTVHPWTSKKYKQKLSQMKNIFHIADAKILPYLAISDVMVSDVSSIIAEFCALDKPIITFETPGTSRSLPEIELLLKRITIRVRKLPELKSAIQHSLQNPKEKSQNRQQANKLMFDKLDGLAGKRAAKIIREQFLF
jgi:CDP-glycerol glycerophosphotransferase (TagB/SpsB family)